MQLIDLDGNTWDGTKLVTKYKPLYDAKGRNEMMGVTLGWLYDAPKFDLKAHDAEIREQAITEFAEACKNHIFCQTFGLHSKTIDEIATELKGE